MSTNITSTRLWNTDFLRITDGNITYYGGDQMWLKRYTQNYGGCAPTAAANILAYMAKTKPELSRLYSYGMKNITKKDFSKFMEEVYKYVTPFEIPVLNSLSDKKHGQIGIPSLGITSVSAFSKAVKRYGQSKGINLKEIWSSQKPTFENAVNYLRKALENDCPVALINMFDPVDMQWIDPNTQKPSLQKYKQHWVTVTGMIENDVTGSVVLEASSWGGKGIFSFNKLWDNDLTSILFPEGMIYFELETKAE